MDDYSFTIECSPSGRNGTVVLTAKLNGEVVAVESLNLAKAKQRTAFAEKVCKGHPGTDVAAVEAELLRLAAELASKPKSTLTDLGGLPELDVSSIVRPERLITPEVSGLAVPTITTMGDKPVGRWILHLRWSDGKREQRPLPASIDLPGNRRHWIHPIPPEPTTSTVSGWSRVARQRWLQGTAAPDPVDVFRRLCERIAYFVDLPREHAPGITATLALWIIVTYVYQAWDAVPYLFVGGPIGSGKSRVFEILSRVVFRPVASSNMTAPAIFRTLHGQGGTLLLDEAERLRQTQAPDVQEILCMLLAGYKRGGQATRLEAVGDTFKTVSFDVYGPKAMACIAGLPAALASRAITITMFRAASGSEKPRRRIDEDAVGWRQLRDDLHALALEHGTTWLGLPKRVEVCPTMSGRDFELWQPLLAVAAWLESHGAIGLLKLMQDHALTTIDAAKDDQVGDADEILLRILAEKRLNCETPQPKEILTAAQEAEPTLFRQWSAKGVSNALRRYGIRTVAVHGRKLYSRMTLEELHHIAATYGVDLGVDEETEEPAMV